MRFAPLSHPAQSRAPSRARGRRAGMRSRPKRGRGPDAAAPNASFTSGARLGLPSGRTMRWRRGEDRCGKPLCANVLEHPDGRMLIPLCECGVAGMRADEASRLLPLPDADLLRLLKKLSDSEAMRQISRAEVPVGSRSLVIRLWLPALGPQARRGTLASQAGSRRLGRSRPRHARRARPGRGRAAPGMPRDTLERFRSIETNGPSYSRRTSRRCAGALQGNLSRCRTPKCLLRLRR